MKKLIFLSCFLLSCANYNEYSLETKYYTPKENMGAYEACMIDLVKAASNQMTTSDYEHPEKVIKQAEWTCSNLYNSSYRVLKIYTKCDIDSYFDTNYYNYNELNTHQKEIFNKLVNGNMTYIVEDRK